MLHHFSTATQSSFNTIAFPKCSLTSHEIEIEREREGERYKRKNSTSCSKISFIKCGAAIQTTADKRRQTKIYVHGFETSMLGINIGHENAKAFEKRPKKITQPNETEMLLLKLFGCLK